MVELLNELVFDQEFGQFEVLSFEDAVAESTANHQVELAFLDFL